MIPCQCADMKCQGTLTVVQSLLQLGNLVTLPDSLQSKPEALSSGFAAIPALELPDNFQESVAVGLTCT